MSTVCLRAPLCFLASVVLEVVAMSHRASTLLSRGRILVILAAVLLALGYSTTAHAYILRTQILRRAPFSQYKDFYVIPHEAPRRLVRLVAHSFETLSYRRVRSPDHAQFLLRIIERTKVMRFRQPVPYYGYGLGYGYGGPFWGPPWGWGGYPFCCGYIPGWGWGWGVYGSPAYLQTYRFVSRRVRVIRIVAISSRTNVPVWRGTVITRFHSRTSLWAMIWHLVNRFPIM